MTVEKLSRGTYAATLSGKTFEFQRWGAEEQTDTLIDLMSVVGDAVGGLTGLYKKAGLDTDVSASAVSELLGALTRGLSRDKALTKRLLKKLSADRVLCEGARIDYDSFYRDDLALSFAVVKANLEVQYGNFFGAVGSFLPAAAPPATNPAPAGP